MSILRRVEGVTSTCTCISIVRFEGVSSLGIQYKVKCKAGSLGRSEDTSGRQQGSREGGTE